jgi:NADH-quinone oxidoreductase subunit N
MHFWAPDVYEAAPTSVVAFFSTVPKVAAIGLLSVLAMPLSNATHDWQFVFALVAVITITVGNFAAIAQQNIKRLMAYSSIAQSGFLVSAIVIFNSQGLAVIVFYSAVYLAANFLIFHYVGLFEQRGIHTVKQYTGTGRVWVVANVGIIVAMISLTGLPPTAGFTAKLLVFTGIWQSFEITHKPILLILLIIGLLNTVVSLFYYLKIPYYAFIKTGNPHERQNFLTIQNLFGLIMVVVILMLFFAPGILMSWINKANFVF